MTDKRFLGFDVSKDDIAGAFHGDTKAVHFANQPQAIADWLKGQDLARVEIAAFEATGGLERNLKEALKRAGVFYARVHPNEVEAYRTRRAIKAKTDDLDALLIAAFAADELSRRGLQPMIEGDDALRELTVRRRQIVDMRQAEKCRLAMARQASVIKAINAILEALQQSLAAIESEIKARIDANHALCQAQSNLKSLKGIGPVSAFTLLAELPELGRVSNKAIASLVGLAPKTRKSGKQTFKARIGHGRPGVRHVLFNAARAAIRHNPIMAAFYHRLTTQNRAPGKVALTAVMRKMLVTLNAIARTGKPWKHQTS